VTISPTDSIESIKKKLKVTEAVACREYLYVRGWLESTILTELTIAGIGTALKNIVRTVNAGKDMKEGAYAIAGVLEAMAQDHLAHTVALCLATKLDRIVDEKMTALTEQLSKADQQIQVTTEEACEELQRATELLNKAAASRPAAQPASLGNLAETQTMNTRTYAAAVHNQLPIGHQTTLACHAVREKQLLIDQCAGSTKTLREWGEDGTVMRANEALKFVGAEDKPDGASFISARLLKNGGAILEVDNADLITWLRVDEHRQNFQQCFDGGHIQVKDREYSVLMQYVPTRHQVDNESEKRQIEYRANIESGEILTTQWVKPEERRSEHQRVAHLIIKVKSIQAANQLLREGAIIAGARVFAKKLKRMPRRCLKCQKFANHLAAACTSVDDICATCGAAHLTHTCKVVDQQLYWCVNCKVHGHASWARTCPSFRQQCDLAAQRDPVSTYRFFPSVDEPWTWDQIERPMQSEHIEPEREPDGWATVNRQNHNRQRYTTRQTYAPPSEMGRATQWTARPGISTNPPVGSRDSGWSNKPTGQANLDGWVRKTLPGTQDSSHDSSTTSSQT